MLTTTLWLLMNLFIVADWGQTRYIAMHEDAFHETNPILGGHPHRDKVDAFFLGSIVVNNGIMRGVDRGPHADPHAGAEADAVRGRRKIIRGRNPVTCPPPGVID